MPNLISQVLEDTIECSMARFALEEESSEWLSKLIMHKMQALIADKDMHNFSWHTICSYVHEKSQAA